MALFISAARVRLLGGAEHCSQKTRYFGTSCSREEETLQDSYRNATVPDTTLSLPGGFYFLPVATRTLWIQ